MHKVSARVLMEDLKSSNLLKASFSVGLWFTICASSLGETVLGAVTLKVFSAVLASGV